MTNERWQRLESLFQQALELDTADRSAFLDRQCADAPRLRHELEELLSADDGIEETWPGLTLGGEDSVLPAEVLSIPSYKIVRLLGQGGMGTVYLALRYDKLFNGKPFAVKILQLGKAKRGGARRFAAERRILSRLDHPYIARLYDGGELPDKTPYLVMDYVDGKPLGLYSREHRLSIDDRLVLCRKICAAVHYAHQNLVVHRDIKPGNILVSADGTPRLLDFGIAKLLDPAGIEDGEELSHNAPSALPYPMTPDYASPEQIRNGVVTTASDLYSLGVVLFQLLTDRLPRQVAKGDGANALPCKPPRPSSVVLGSDASEVARDRRLSPARLRRRLEGDLDDIVMKALDPEPAQRYASAQQLAEDLRCHLMALPVTAGRGDWWYRAGKFLRRHRLQLVLAGALAAATALTLTAFVQSRRLERTTAVLRQLAGPRTDPLMSEDFLDRAVGDIVASDEPPRSKALLMEVVRRLYVPDEALFEDVLAVFGENQPSASQALEMAELSLNLGRLLFAKGWMEQAEPTLRVSLRQAKQAHGHEAPALVPYMNALAATLTDLGAFDEAEELLRRGLDVRRRALGPRHPDVGISLHQLGELMNNKGAFGEAESFYRRSMEVLRADEGTDPLMLADHVNSLALVLMEQGEYEEAERLIRQALGIRRQRLGEMHQDIVQSLSNLFVVLARKGDVEASVPIGQRAVELAELVLGPDHLRLAHPLLGLAAAYRKLGQPALCERYARRAIALREAHLPASHWLIALARSTLGDCLTDLGQYDEAEDLLRASWSVLDRARGPGDLWTRTTRQRLDRLQNLRGEVSPAGPD